MSIFDSRDTGVKFCKIGSEVKQVIDTRLIELQNRLTKRNEELEEVMNNKPLLRSYLVRDHQNDYPHRSQLKAEMPSEDHQRITELCRRIRLIEEEFTELSIVQNNLKDNQELELSLGELTKLGFGSEYYELRRV